MRCTPEPSPRSRVEGCTSLTGSSLRPRSVTGRKEEPTEIRPSSGDGSWLRADGPSHGHLPAMVPDRGTPQGVAESRNDDLTPFSHVPSAMARELSKAAPSFPNSTPAPSRGGMPMPLPADSGALSRTTRSHVQFAKSPDTVPGEVPGTPSGTLRAATFADGLPPASTPASGCGTFTPAGGLSSSLFRTPTTNGSLVAPSSPERPPKKLSISTAATMKRLQSQRVPLSTRGTGPGACSHHWAPLDRPQDVEQLPLELVLQHSSKIEKITAPELLPFAKGVQPFFYGLAPNPATIKGVKGFSELKTGAWHVQSDITDAAASGNREVITGTLGWPRSRPVYVQLYVLFPSLMRPPRWLRRDFKEVKGAAVEVSWELSKRAKFFLFLTRQHERAERQHLTVWASKRRYGGESTFTLYGAEGTSELTDRSYVLLLKFVERREGPGPKSFTMSREGALRASRSDRLPIMRLSNPGNGAAGAPVVGGPGGAGSEILPSATSFAGLPPGLGLGLGSTLPKGLTKLQEMQALLLRAQSSDVSYQFLIPEDGVATWDMLFDHLIHSRDGPMLRFFIESHYADPFLKRQEYVDKVEKVAVYTSDPALMLTLYQHTPVEMDLNVLAFLLHAWATQPLSGRAAAAAAAAASRAASAVNLAQANMMAAAGTGGGGGFAGAAGAGDGEWLDGELRTRPETDPRLAQTWRTRTSEGGEGTNGDGGGEEDLESADPEFGLAAKIEEFLVKYVVARRNPLSTTAAILRAIEEEMNKHEDNRRPMRLAFTRFHSLHLALLRRLNRYADPRNIRLVERVLQPTERPNTVNEVSPLQVAFDSSDLKFMTESLVELYVNVQWVGRELLALTAHEDPRATGATNPLLAYSVLRSLGFAGKGTLDPLVMFASRLWHLYAFTSTAFFDSPRGRWAMHLLCELAFLFLYQWQVMYPDLDVRHLQLLHLVFLAFILGNLVDMMQFVHYRYGSLARMRRFLIDPWNALSVLVNASLAALTCLKLAQDYNAPGLPPYTTADAIHMCMATLAVFVWIRALGMAVPAYPSLGPLLNTMARMVEEVVAFLFPMVVIMTGFSTMMTAVYQDLVPSYGSFIDSMLQLFSSMLGNFDFTLFDGLSTPQMLYGNIAQVVFLVISSVLLLNLLVAMLTNRYRPQEVEAETQFKKAQIVTFYNTQVTRNLVCSPFCLAQVSLQTISLPAPGRRNKLQGSGQQLGALGLLPLDGVVLPDDGSDRPTGLAELPHLIYLLTLYPLIAVVTWLLFLLYTPFGVWQFAAKQYTHLGKLYRKRHQQKERKRQKEAAEARKRQQQQQQQKKEKQKEEEGGQEEDQEAVERRTLSKESFASTVSGSQRQGISTTPPDSPPDNNNTNNADPDAGAAAGGSPGGGPPAASATTSVAVSRSSSHNLGGSNAEAVKQYQRLKKALQAESHQADMGIMPLLGFAAGTTVLTVLGLLLYLVVGLGVVLVGWSSVYQWAAKVGFSLFNIFVRPMRDYFKARRRNRRVAPAPISTAVSRSPSAAAGGNPEGEKAEAPPAVRPPRGSHVALDVASGAAAAAAAGAAVPGAHGCGTDGGCRPSAVGDGGRVHRGFFAFLRPGGGVGGNGKQPVNRTAGVEGAAEAAVSDATARDAEWRRKRKSRLRWQNAMTRVLALKNERYLTRRDVLKAVAASKFKPHMAGWNLSVDPRSSSQDILEEQMADLEDDDDPWDDDVAAAAGGDDDTIENIILDRTDALTALVKDAATAQHSALAALMERLAALAEEVSTLQRAAAAAGGVGGGGYGTLTAAATGSGVSNASGHGGGFGAADPRGRSFTTSAMRPGGMGGGGGGGGVVFSPGQTLERQTPGSQGPVRFELAANAPHAFGLGEEALPGFGLAANAPHAFGLGEEALPGFELAANAPHGFGLAANAPHGFGLAANAPHAFGLADEAPPGFGPWRGQQQLQQVEDGDGSPAVFGTGQDEALERSSGAGGCGGGGGGPGAMSHDPELVPLSAHPTGRTAGGGGAGGGRGPGVGVTPGNVRWHSGGGGKPQHPAPRMSLPPPAFKTPSASAAVEAEAAAQHQQEATPDPADEEEEVVDDAANSPREGGASETPSSVSAVTEVGDHRHRTPARAPTAFPSIVSASSDGGPRQPSQLAPSDGSAPTSPTGPTSPDAAPSGTGPDATAPPAGAAPVATTPLPAGGGGTLDEAAAAAATSEPERVARSSFGRPTLEPIRAVRHSGNGSGGSGARTLIVALNP